MSKGFFVINMVAAIYLAALIVGYLQYVNKENNELEQLKLSYAIDYAADAGAMAMLNTGDLATDYTNKKAVTVDPQLALDTFLDVFCFNYDMPPIPANKAMIKDYIPIAAVAGFDGYYLATQQLVKNGGGNYPETPASDSDWELIFGMKLPYTHKYGGTSYALNMGLNYTLALTGDSLTRQTGLPPTASGTMSETDAKALINNMVSNHMAESINETNKANPNWKNRFYIPSQLTTYSGVNSIEGPSFLILLQGVRLSTSRPISGFSVSGSKIDNARLFVGYIRDGTKYYAYADKAPPNIEYDPGNGVVYQSIYRTAKDAAKDGYYFDIQKMVE